jgi:FkbM family methyltransferase
MPSLQLLLNRLRGRDTVVESEFQGLAFRLVVTTGREIRRARELDRETELLGRIREVIRPGDTLYDVGANIGLISILTALHPSGASVRVHSFEPEPRNFAHLRRNLELNGLGHRVQAHAVALGAEEGEAVLHVRGAEGEGRHSIATDKGSSGSIRVPLTTADEFARSIGEPPDIVKIDVEGAEGRVLRGMEDLLQSGRPRELLLEIHAKGDGDRMPDGETIHHWLESRGYVLAWRNRRRSGEHCHYHLQKGSSRS